MSCGVPAVVEFVLLRVPRIFFADSSLPCAFQDVLTSHVMRTQAEFVFQDHGSEVPDSVRATCGPNHRVLELG